MTKKLDEVPRPQVPGRVSVAFRRKRHFVAFLAVRPSRVRYSDRARRPNVSG